MSKNKRNNKTRLRAKVMCRQCRIYGHFGSINMSLSEQWYIVIWLLHKCYKILGTTQTMAYTPFIRYKCCGSDPQSFNLSV